MKKRFFWWKIVWRCFQRDYNSSNTTYSIGFLDSTSTWKWPGVDARWQVTRLEWRSEPIPDGLSNFFRRQLDDQHNNRAQI